MAMGNNKQCWAYLDCEKKDCPAYGEREPECWTMTTECFRQLDRTLKYTFLACFECEIFNSNAPDGTRQLANVIRDFHCSNW
jgi:two-component system, NtrC family, sensor kinase